MAATTMFVEVLVIGIGSLSALSGFVIAVAGYENLKGFAPIAGSGLASGMAIAFSYALGILVDRSADTILKSARRSLRRQHFPSNAAYDQARRLVVKFPDLVARADYARSRMRVCRGWFLNSILLVLAVDLLLIRSSFQGRLLFAFLVTVVGVLLAIGFYIAWRSITETGYKKLAQQSQAIQADVPAQQAGAGSSSVAGDVQS
ncbi:hypothetical protein ACODT3_21705 [Streptomyces sp. 4.24]|uniref:hypothetical protein n=1 Tax=Streptomyces tritrimontium TaxID=3406573 RepID=UPI003BB51122